MDGPDDRGSEPVPKVISPDFCEAPAHPSLEPASSPVREREGHDLRRLDALVNQRGKALRDGFGLPSPGAVNDLEVTAPMVDHLLNDSSYIISRNRHPSFEPEA
jgi:hypothetical protein